MLIPATLESLVSMRNAFDEAIGVIQARLGIAGGGDGGGGGGGMNRAVGSAVGGGRGGFQPRQDRARGPANSRKVFVTNLSWDTDEATLEDHFSSAGVVIGSDLMETRSGRKLGKGTVEFETADGAAAAIRDLNGTDLDGRTIGVREDRGSTRGAL